MEKRFDMKKYDSIVKRVGEVESKLGIQYAKTDGKLFRGIKFFYILAFAYTMGINLLYFAGIGLMYSDTDMSPELKNMVITVAICTAVLIAGFVLLCTKLKITGGIVSIFSLPFMLLSFANSLEDTLGFWGYKASFYWRHFIPIVLLFLLALWMTVIAIRAKVIFESQYKRITVNLYEAYSNMYSADKDNLGISDEQWDEFLANYNSMSFRKAKKNKKKIKQEENVENIISEE